MTVTLPISRSLAKGLLARSARSLTRPLSNNPVLRVPCNCAADNDYPDRYSKYSNTSHLLKQARTYATAAAKPAGRPKQHTGRTAAKKTTSSAKKTTTAKKPVKKAKKKPVKKAAPKAKKAPSKTALLKKEREKQAALRAAALLEEPKQLPSTVYQLVLVEEHKNNGTPTSVGVVATAAATRSKSLSLEEREKYNHEANENKAKNAEAYRKWVLSHTPSEIKDANNARRQLTKQARAAGKKKTYRRIADDRIVQGPRNSYTWFSKERNGSGDLNGMTVGERGKLIGQEWKKLSAAEKKQYEDLAQTDAARYRKDYKTVYGVDSPSAKKTA